MQNMMVRVAIAATLTCGVLSPAHASPAPLDFDKTFNASHAPAAAHFRAAYEAGGQTHLLEVWRNRDRQLKRRTDNAIETYVSKPTNDPEWSMAVLDLRRKIRTDIDRTNLYRVGHFADWFGMAHGLSRPIGAYELHRIAAASSVHRPIAACDWYQLSNQRKTTNICWSEKMKLPLIIATAGGNDQWWMLEADTHPSAAEAFQVADEGFARNNANADINND